MVRSLYDGISGLRVHQVAMDVAGNNIANVNTFGFKAGRITFKESMAQLLKGSSRPPGNAGGTNPIQLGLGAAVGSIDTLLTQGNLQSTGQITDLALEGRAYFAYSNGEGTFYSRLGAMQFDSTGRLVSPTNGFVLQGLTAAQDGTYPASSRIGDIRIPYGEKAPAKETSLIQYGCNLDSDSEGLGTIDHSNAFFATARPAGTDTLTSLYDSKGNDLGIRTGDTLTVSIGNVPAVPPVSIPVTETTTLEDLRAAIQQVAAQVSPGFITAVINPDGTISVNNGSAVALQNLQVSSTRPGSNSYVTSAFGLAPTIAAATTESTQAIMRPAESTDLLANVTDAAGQSLGLEDGDVITINGALGGAPVTPGTVTYSSAAVGGTTLGDVLQSIQATFGLPATDGTIYQRPSVSMDAGNTDDDLMPDGSIVVRGQREVPFAITNLTITASNSNLNAVAPTRLNANAQTTELQAARNTGEHSSSIVVYDESGDAHTLTTTWTHTGTPNEWLWEITTNGGEAILGGNRGRISFGQDGSPSAFTYDDQSTSFRFDPMNGSNEVDIALDVGLPGSYKGITQFRSPSTTVAKFQDGYPMGKLEEISINEFGEIQGQYTNGVSKSIARILVAEFNNPAGLMKEGDSMFGTSNNSGEAIMLQPGVGSATRIKPGALEMSNVELATEFTNMITTQRGFQANARVITTSDSMLQELVQLIR